MRRMDIRLDDDDDDKYETALETNDDCRFLLETILSTRYILLILRH